MVVASYLFNYVTAPLSLFSAFVCGIAVISSYIFPQQRKFPNVVLVWTCAWDFLFALFLAIMWLPGPARSYFVDQMPQNPNLCSFSLYAMLAMQEGTSISGILLAHTLYTNVVKRIDMEEKKPYYYGYIAILWIPTILVPCLCFLEPEHLIATGYCALKSRIGTGVRICNWIFMLSIQIILMINVFKVVCTVTNAVHQHAYRVGSSNTFFWLLVRCVGATVNQIVIWFPATVIELMSLRNERPGIILTGFAAITPLFLSINGFIVLAGNKPLRVSAHTLFSNCFSKEVMGSRNPPEKLRASSMSQ